MVFFNVATTNGIVNKYQEVIKCKKLKRYSDTNVNSLLDGIRIIQTDLKRDSLSHWWDQAFPHLVDVPPTASLIDIHENGLPRVVQSPSVPSGAVTPCAFLKLILHFGEPWPRGLRKQRWLPAFVVFLSWHSYLLITRKLSPDCLDLVKHRQISTL